MSLKVPQWHTLFHTALTFHKHGNLRLFLVCLIEGAHLSQSRTIPKIYDVSQSAVMQILYLFDKVIGIYIIMYI